MRRLGDPWFNRLGMRGVVPWGNAPGGYGGVEEFSPLDISNLEWWVYADQITGLIDGDPISTWEDQSGNGRNFTQAGVKRPTYQNGAGDLQNGLPVVRFDGSDDILVANYAGHEAAGTIIIVGKDNLGTTQYDYWCGFGDTALNRVLATGVRMENAKPYMNVNQTGGITDIVNGDTVADTLFKIYETTSSGIAYFLYIDNIAEVLAVQAGANTGDWLDVVASNNNVTLGGCRYNGGETLHLNCDIGEAMYYSKQISAEERILLVDYLRTKWGTP